MKYFALKGSGVGPILDRLVTVHDEILIPDLEFQEHEEKPSEIFKRLCAKLAPEDKKFK